MLRFCSLSASSKGNCYLLQYEQYLLCIDLGISWKRIKQHLLAENICSSQIIGACISHEHNDHTKGILTFQKELNLPIHCNFLTAEALCEIYAQSIPCRIFTNEEPFTLGPFTITAFGLAHDASDPVGFKVQCGSSYVAFCTDLGFIHPGIVHYLKDLDALVIESNHDVALVRSSKRPELYKQRVLSRCGHISNKECGKLLREIYSPRLQHVALGHLSEDCNREELAVDECRRSLDEACEKYQSTNSEHRSSCKTPKIIALPSSSPSDWITIETSDVIEKVLEKA